MREYAVIQDISATPYKTRNEVGPGISINTPTVTINDAAGIYVEPLNKETNNYNMRRIKIVDDFGAVLFELYVNASYKTVKDTD